MIYLYVTQLIPLLTYSYLNPLVERHVAFTARPQELARGVIFLVFSFIPRLADPLRACFAYLISMTGITNHGPFWSEAEQANGYTWRFQLFCYVSDHKWNPKWNPKWNSTLVAHSHHRTSVLMIPANGKWIRSGPQIFSASSLSDVKTDMINFFVFHFGEYSQLLTSLLFSEIQFHSSYLRPLLAGECKCSP